VETFRHLLRGAVAAGASDVHLKANAPVMFRINRELRPVEMDQPTESWMDVVLREIVPSHLRDQWQRDREIDFALAVAGIGRFRVNVFQQRGSFVAAFRVVRSVIRDFDELHLPPIVRHIAESRNGIVLLAGAPGAGKSTTLAAMIQHLNGTVRRHILTLEDPIEYFFEDQLSVIEQREIGLDTASFQTGLHNVLRQDPDVLVIGEMRDVSSAAAAVSAANVGTLVLSTLHTNDAARSIQRVLEFFPADARDDARRQLATTLRAVVCQRLVRNRAGLTLPAVEVMINTAGVAKLIEANRLDQLNGAIELGEGDGMQSFERSLTQLLDAGYITPEEALAHAPNPEAFKMRLKGVVLSESKRILGSRG
jgi:twitching motility protein PilT